MLITIDYDNFTPGASLLGGAILGLSSAAYLLLAGRIAGISGLLVGALDAAKQASTADAEGLRRSFIAALVFSGAAHTAAGGADLAPAAAIAPLVLGGALVGLGAGLQHGCTSGHGVCGLSRRSPKSLVLVCVFMAAGVLTATAARSALVEAVLPATALAGGGALANLIFNGGAALALATSFRASRAAPMRPVVGTLCGAGFGAGLLVSGMAQPAKIVGFLKLDSPGGWDPSLAFVMAGAIGAAMYPFSWAQRQCYGNKVGSDSEEEEDAEEADEGVQQQQQQQQRPQRGASGNTSMATPARAPWLFPGTPFASMAFLQPASWSAFAHKPRSMLGATLFGAGWAIAGMCPGPGLVLAGAGSPSALAFIPAVLGGLWLARAV
jgi:uncharacterized protein